MERLSAEDRLMLWGDRTWPQDIGVIGVLDGRSLLDRHGQLRLDSVRTAVRKRLHLLPRFRQVLYEPPRLLGAPLWVDAPAFDVADHVHAIGVPAPGDEEQLLRTVEDLSRWRLDHSRPLWDLWLLPGLAGRRVGLFARLHHTVADGMAGVATLATLLDPAADTTSLPSAAWTPSPPPTLAALAADEARRRVGAATGTMAAVLRPWQAAREVAGSLKTMREVLAQRPGPHTSLDRLVGSERRSAVVRTLLEPVRDVAHGHDATVNDVLLAAIAGGVRRLLRSRGELVEHLTLPIYVPISLRRGSDRPGEGNLISQMAVGLPLGTTSASGRLREIAAQTAHHKTCSEQSLGFLFRGGVAGRAIVMLVARQRVNLTSADLTGPTTRLSLAGAPLLEVFPVLPLIGSVTLGVAALSYAGQLNLTVVADADTCPDVAVVAAGIRDELRALGALSQHATAAV